jgi:hypothetical protein
MYFVWESHRERESCGYWLPDNFCEVSKSFLNSYFLYPRIERDMLVFEQSVVVLDKLIGLLNSFGRPLCIPF